MNACVSNHPSHAIQGFVKDFLEVPDTLERALSTVQESLEQAGSEGGVDALDKDKATSLLKGLVEGIELTDKIMMQVDSCAHVLCALSPVDTDFWQEWVGANAVCRG